MRRILMLLVLFLSIAALTSSQLSSASPPLGSPTFFVMLERLLDPALWPGAPLLRHPILGRIKSMFVLHVAGWMLVRLFWLVSAPRTQCLFPASPLAGPAQRPQLTSATVLLCSTGNLCLVVVLRLRPTLLTPCLLLTVLNLLESLGLVLLLLLPLLLLMRVLLFLRWLRRRPALRSILQALKL
jgi:hypothetical protein